MGNKSSKNKSTTSSNTNKESKDSNSLHGSSELPPEKEPKTTENVSQNEETSPQNSSKNEPNEQKSEQSHPKEEPSSLQQSSQSSKHDLISRKIPPKPSKNIDDYEFDDAIKLKPEELLNMCVWEIQNSKGNDDPKQHIIQSYRSIKLYKCDDKKTVKLVLRNECGRYLKEGQDDDDDDDELHYTKFFFKKTYASGTINYFHPLITTLKCV